MKTGYYLHFRGITPFELFLAWNLHLRYIMMKQKFIARYKNDDVFLTTLSRKFREAGYNLTAHSDSQNKKENDSLFSITPINSDNVWCFNVCKTDGY